MPEEDRAEYMRVSQMHNQKIAKIREDFEQHQARDDYSKLDFKEARAAVIRLRSAIKEWKEVLAVHGGSKDSSAEAGAEAVAEAVAEAA